MTAKDGPRLYEWATKSVRRITNAISILTGRPTRQANMWRILSPCLAAESGTGTSGNCVHWSSIHQSHAIQFAPICRYVWATRSVLDVYDLKLMKASEDHIGLLFVECRARSGWASDICCRRVHWCVVHLHPYTPILTGTSPFFACLPLAFAGGRLEPIVRSKKFEYQHGGVAAEHSCVLRCGNAKSIALTLDVLVLA